MVVVAPGLPSLDKLLVETILSDQFVDLAEMPPAKGSAPAANKILDGHNLYIVRPTKRLIPDFPTWLQCFSVYSAVLILKYPERATSLLLYQKNIAYLSQRFRWPSWVVYDNSFRSEAADNAKTDWSLIDYGVHSRSFHNQTLIRDSWCANCHSVDHLQADCPYAKTGAPPKKRPAAAPYPMHSKRPNAPICMNFNRTNCRYGPRCNYRHVCLRCQGPRAGG